MLSALTDGMEAESFLDTCRQEINAGTISLARINALIRLMLVSIDIDTKKEKASL